MSLVKRLIVSLGLVGLLGGCATTSNVSREQEVSDGLARAVDSFGRDEVVDSPHIQKMRTKYGCVGVGTSQLNGVEIREDDARRGARINYVAVCLDFPVNILLVVEDVQVNGLKTKYYPKEWLAVAYCPKDENCRKITLQ